MMRHAVPRVVHRPAHLPARGARAEALLERRELALALDHHPHEEAPGVAVVELPALDDVEAGPGEEARDVGDDAGDVLAREAQDDLLGHGRCPIFRPGAAKVGAG
jgi:hypothetical protein